MSIVRRLARPMLAAGFIESGLSTLRDPGPQVEQVRPLVAQVAGPLRLPSDPATFLRVDGALMVGAGGLLALGRMPRLAALVLVAGSAPATYAEIAHWREKDPQQRRERRRELLTRLGLIGGALLATVDTAGRPGLAWRSRHAVEQVQHSAAGVTGGSAMTAGLVGRGARRRARRASQKASQAGRRTAQQAKATSRQTRQRAKLAREQTRQAVEQTRRQAREAAKTARAAVPV